MLSLEISGGINSHNVSICCSIVSIAVPMNFPFLREYVEVI